MFSGKKNNSPARAADHSTEARLLDGLTVLSQVEHLVRAAIVLAPTLWAHRVEEARHKAQLQASDPGALLGSRRVSDGSAALGLAAGLALTGNRATVVTDSAGIWQMQPMLHQLAARHVPLVIALGLDAPPRQAVARFDRHDALEAVRDTGCIVFVAGSVQEITDDLLLARRLAEQALIPSVVAFDLHACGLQAQPVELPLQSEVDRLVGSASDCIDSPTPAQVMLFGQQRRRIPKLLTLDRPAGFTPAIDGPTSIKSSAGQYPYFFAAVPSLLESTLRAFKDITGRKREAVHAYRSDDAQYLVVAAGAITESLRRAVDEARTQRRLKVGMADINIVSPTPTAALSHLLVGKKVIIAIEQCDLPHGPDGVLPITGLLHHALACALENGRSRKAPLPYPEYTTLADAKSAPAIYTVAATNTTGPQALVSLIHNIALGSRQRRFVYAGVKFLEPPPGYPKLEIVRQQLRREVPLLEECTLPESAPAEARTAEAPSLPAAEPDAPWPVRQTRTLDGTLFDLGRFWDMVGVLEATGKMHHVLVDPHLSLAAVPAHSGLFRAAPASGKQILRFIPQNLSRCESCWAHPASLLAGIQVTLQHTEAILETAIRLAQQSGSEIVRLPHLAHALASIAYKLIAGDDQQILHTAGALFQAAFEQLLQKTALKAEQKSALESEYRAVAGQLAPLVIARTQRFFDERHAQKKGSGLLLCFAIDPDAYRDGSACLHRWPDGTLELVTADETLLAEYRQSRRFLNAMPPVPIETIAAFIRPEHPEDTLLYWLNQRVYRSLLPVPQTPAANGVPVALHLLLGAVEAAMRPHIQAFTQRLTSLRDRLEEKIRNLLNQTLQVNDLEAFGEKLAQWQEAELDASRLAVLLTEEHAATQIDKNRLQRLTTLYSRLGNYLDMYTSGPTGRGRASLFVVIAGRDPSLWGTVFPDNPLPVPWVLASEDGAHEQAAGVYAGVREEMLEMFKDLRLAELELQDRYRPAQHQSLFATFSEDDLRDDERNIWPQVYAIFIGEPVAQPEPGRIAKTLSGGLPLKIVLLNTRAVQLPEPAHFDLSGKPAAIPGADEPGMLALLYPQCLVLQSSIGAPGHLVQGLLRACSYMGPALMHIDAPVLEEHEDAAAALFSYAETSVASRTFPLFTYEPRPGVSFGRSLSLDGNPAPDDDWATQTLELTNAAGLPAREVEPLTPAQVAMYDYRLNPHLRPCANRDWHDAMRPLADYLQLPEAERQGLEPYILGVDAKKRLIRYVVSKELVALAAARLAFWRRLRELARLGLTPEAEIEARAQQQAETAIARAREEIHREYEAQLSALKEKHGQLYHAQLTERLLQLSGFGGEAREPAMTLREYVQRIAEASGSAEN